MRKYVLLLFLLCLYGLARGQTSEYVGFYWFDNETMAQEATTLNGLFEVNASSLAEGLHTFHYMAVKKDGGISLPSTNYFMKLSPSETSQKGFYWFDNETTAQEATTLNGLFEVDASLLSDGFHQFSYIAIQENGGLAKPASCYFLKTAQIAENDSLTCICSVDGRLRHIEKLSQDGGIIHWNLDMEDLTDGIHQIQLQAVTKSGALSSSYSSYFMRVTTNEELNKMRCVYAIDNGSLHTNSYVVSSNGSYHFDLDLSELDDGLHYISVLLHNDRGTISKVQTRFFVKVPLGGNGITQYQFWLNDDDFSMAKTVTLPQKVNPLQLMSLLPVESRPLRSSLFLFDVSSGKPMIYAKNTIHLRFYDAAMRFTDAAKDYADYSVGQEVNVIKTLESGERETTIWPEENEIKWYQVVAERGDSLRFKLDHAATLQLFAPSGKEVYNASGAESVSWGGLHAAESGTFYVALHDVTATQGDDITIDYEHIDKYAVLRQDVAVVGNGGCSTITFEGNGFRDLYAVDLYNEQGDSIKHIYIDHESDATTSIVFDFTGAALGVYHAKFHFTEEDKVFTKIVTVEEARAIELATTVTYPSTFLRGTSTTYSIKITNKGNMTAYGVPVFIRIKTKGGDVSMNIKELGYPKLSDYVDMNELTEEQRKLIEEIDNELNGNYIDLTHNKDEYILPPIFINISPNSIAEITPVLEPTIDVQSIEVDTHVPKYWNSLVDGAQEIRNNYCCIHEEIECWTSAGSTALDIISILLLEGLVTSEATAVTEAIGCVSSAISSLSSYASEFLCDSNVSIKEKLYSLENLNKGFSVLGTIISCGIATKVMNIGKFIRNAFKFRDALSAVWTCKNMFDKLNNCDEISAVEGFSQAVTSLDPNDIYGYTAPSGSHTIRDGLTDVYYRIEFENDPEFATAAAHKIVVADTLDVTKFDLSSFAPTRVKIGEKSAELNGDKNFVTTIDMRPEINAIAQVEGMFDQKKGIAKWHIMSLDPMTMEPTNDVMQGVLPVNYNGNGIGELSYDISLKPGLAHGIEVNNRASIVFDTNEPIMTPTWTNVIDRIAPESHIADVKMLNDSTAVVSVTAMDELSGPWRYNVYVQYGEGSAWFLEAENIPTDTTASVKIYEGIDHGFYVVMTDSAGNVEQKDATREFTLDVFGSHIDTYTKVELAEGWNWISHNQNAPLPVDAVKPKARDIVSQTAELHKDSQQIWTGHLEELLPTEMYKVQATEAYGIQLSGPLFYAAFRSIPLKQGWNWISFPVANVMSVNETMAKLKAEEGDALISQDGIALFSDGNWKGTLTTMEPGVGYMYRSASKKNLFFNVSAQVSARRAMPSASKKDIATWSADKRKHRNVMGIVGHLYNEDGTLVNNDNWMVGAFCKDECRGIAQDVDGHLMMNVYGEDGETILFQALNLETGEIYPIYEEVPMHSDLLGSFHSPYDLHIGSTTGVVSTDHLQTPDIDGVYDIHGRKVDKAYMTKGIYMVVKKKQHQIQKVIK